MRSLILLVCCFQFSVFAQSLVENYRQLNQSLERKQNELSRIEQQYKSLIEQDQEMYRAYQAQRQRFDQADAQYRNGQISSNQYQQYVSQNNLAVERINSVREELDAVKAQMNQKRNEIQMTRQTINEYENEIKLQGLTVFDTNIYRPFTGRKDRFGSSSNVEVNKNACEALRQERENFPQMDDPDYLSRYQLIQQLQNMCAVNVRLDNLEVVGFSLRNDLPSRSNPRGTGTHDSSSREWTFKYDNRSIQNMLVEILDDSKLSGRMSHDFLHTTLLFLPRKNIPSIAVNEDEISCQRKVYLPTGEFVIFSALTNEIVGGVLKEDPMDFNSSRHARKFAGVKYSGNGIMIRTDRRSGIPQVIYDTAFNQNEDIKNAIITHKGKECRVSKDKLWTNTRNHDETPIFKFATDQEFLDVIINPLCGWNLTMDDIS